MRINEIFLSLQGEGIYTGEKMLFIRTEYCNLRCSWCDTKYSFNEGTEYSLDRIIDIIHGWHQKTILTGYVSPVGNPYFREI
ncbi:7-carboxy-7-deazaguanine synthase QueE [Acidiplasma cupricumulans]|uniref:7-carboxy-7-deazaguanine synthase QueE n=1 Tax=Acidiplasma cupricumulans TaxID=312540 RepID=UPI0007817C75|nr:7-carboxy-7-deazaguanine synthase QueE [Acidiplasma cupricumulans]